MKIARIPLQNHSRFHFGELKLDENLALSTTSFFAHSDTLFSALVNGYSRFNGEAESFIEGFKDGKIRISSLFYYIQNADFAVYFLPKPAFLAIHSPKSKDGLHKKRNRVKFVSHEVWKKGFEPALWFKEGSDQYRDIQDTFIVTKTEYEALNASKNTVIAQSVHSPKSPLRASENAAIFYQADVETGGNQAQEVGWYFMYEVADEEIETKLKIATNVMSYTGIGGEIHHIGRGPKRHPEFEEIAFDLSGSLEKYASLSLLNPRDDNELKAVIYYNTLLRGGRLIPGGGQAKVVRMIGEGALLNANNIQGRLLEIGKDEQDRTIYRNGMPLLIPVKYDY